MVDSVVMMVFKSTAMMLFNKGKKRALAKLQHSGDAIDQTICSLIAGELDEIKSELRAARAAPLKTSIDLYKEGLTSISFDTAEPPLKRMRVDQLDGSAVPTFYKVKVEMSDVTKKRFADARLAAGEALGNTKLDIKEIILAFYVKIMATLLEDADTDPARAILFCKNYLEKLNSLPKISNEFHQGLVGSPWQRAASFTSKRVEVIWSVCHLNRIVFDVAQFSGADSVLQELFVWPCISIGSSGSNTEEVDPLRDPRLDKLLKSEDKELCSVILSFGDNNTHKLTLPCSVASNPQDQYLVVNYNTTDKFSSHGKFLDSLTVPTEGCAVDVATDKDGRVYLLVTKKQDSEGGNMDQNYEVFLYDNDGKHPSGSFPLRSNSKGLKLAVNQHSDKIELLVLEGKRGQKLHARVEVYEANGTFLSQFGERILQDAQDIVSGNDGHVFVLDKCHESEKKFIREFGVDGCQLRRYSVGSDSLAIAFCRPSKSVIVVSASNPNCFEVAIHQVADGKHNDRDLQLLRKLKVEITGILLELHATVTQKGRIAIVMAKNSDCGKPQGELIIY